MSDEAATQPPSLLQIICHESRERRNLPMGPFIGNFELLERVREYERHSQSQQLVPTMSSAKAEDIERLALIDGLTELYNHRTFLKELKAELSRCRRYKHHMSLCMLVVDDHEDIVRKYGHLTGDSVMKVVANVLRGALRELDIPAKYADQQFCIVLPGTHVAGAALVAERIRQRIGNQAIAHNWQSFSVTASLGVAAYPSDANEYDELIARATEAMGYAIARGGDRVLAA
jgi:two-component system cell cycle response regulator